MSFSMIFAIAEDGSIGHKNKLLWYIPEDLKYFKEKTQNHKVVYGRKTLDSMGILPNRHNIILTRDSEFKLSEEQLKKINATTTYEIINDVELFIKHNQYSEEEIFIVGGSEIYRKFVNKSTKIYATLVYKEFSHADTKMDLDISDFEIINETKLEKYEDIEFNYVTLKNIYK